MGGMREVDKRVVAGLEMCLPAELFDEDLALGDHVDLADIRIHETNVLSLPVCTAWFGGTQFTDSDGAKPSGAHLIGQLLTVAGSYVERTYRDSQCLAEIFAARSGGNVLCAYQDAHDHILGGRILPRTRGKIRPAELLGHQLGER